MNIQPSKKHGFSPEEIEKRALQRKGFRTVNNMHILEKTDKLNQRQDRYDKKKYGRKRKRLRENLNIGEKVYVFTERIKKKNATGKFYKQTVQNISYFNKDTVFIIRKKQTFDDIMYYWVESPLRQLNKSFQRSELFALKSNFL